MLTSGPGLATLSTFLILSSDTRPRRRRLICLSLLRSSSSNQVLFNPAFVLMNGSIIVTLLGSSLIHSLLTYEGVIGPRATLQSGIPIEND